MTAGAPFGGSSAGPPPKPGSPATPGAVPVPARPDRPVFPPRRLTGGTPTNTLDAYLARWTPPWPGRSTRPWRWTA